MERQDIYSLLQMIMKVIRKEKPKMYVVRKYIKALSVSQALRKDKTTQVHDCYVDESWKENNLSDAIGFVSEPPIEEEEEDEE